MNATTTPGTLRVLRYTINVNDGGVIPAGRVVHVDCRESNGIESVDVWVEVTDETLTVPVAVFGTGHEVPIGAHHVGSALTHYETHTGKQLRGGLVWHVYQLAATTEGTTTP